MFSFRDPAISLGTRSTPEKPWPRERSVTNTLRHWPDAVTVAPPAPGRGARQGQGLAYLSRRKVFSRSFRLMTRMIVTSASSTRYSTRYSPERSR